MRRLLLLLVLPFAATLARAEEILVAGGPDDFARVRHVRLEGSQEDIGRALARIALRRYGWVPREDVDPRRTAAQKSYFATNAPLYLARMRGVAAEAGVPFADDAFNVAGLVFGMQRGGCSVIYLPPKATTWGGSVVSRNYDFTTGTMAFTLPGPDEMAVCSEPYVLELYPEEGHASLAVVSFDLLGVVDGINDEGLVVALLADDEVMRRAAPAHGPQAGFGVLQIARHLLDTCADVPEAQAALLQAKLYYTSIPCHYLVADRHGRSFVWENSPTMTEGFLFDGGGEVQVTTNFMWQLHPDPAKFPEEPSPYGSFSRYRRVMDAVREKGGKLDLDGVRAAGCSVANTMPMPPPPRAGGRTLWHALYFPEERRMEVDFYMGEGEGGEPKRSGYLRFALGDAR